jgi:inosine-uridine nucleoside N-ribohydrolase
MMRKLCICFKIPIFRGADSALVPAKSYKEIPPYFGEDGFGDAGFPKLVPRINSSEDGVSAIISYLRKYKGFLKRSSLYVGTTAGDIVDNLLIL